MLPEDYHSYGRKRKYARYSEVAKHPDVLGLMGQLDRDRGLHGVLADRIEELGFPEIAAHVRENPQPGSSWESPVAAARPEHRAALAAGQPYAMWWPVSGRHEKAGQRVVVMLGLPHKTDSYRSFTSEVMGRPQAAAKLRGLAADGVAVHTVTRSRPHNVRLLNTDESAARRLARLRYARFSQLKGHPDLAAWHEALKADPGKQGIFADWVEEQGFPAMAGLMRQSRPPTHHDAAGPYDPAAEVQHRGQPTLVHFPMAGDRHGLSLFTVAKGGDRLHWHVTTDRLTAARLVRGLAAEGVGVVHRRTPLGRYGERVTNTDESAAKRSRRKYAQKKPRTADFLTAVRVLRGSGQKRLHAVAEDIARGLGLAPAKTRDALLDGPRGALPGVAQAVAGADPHTARYAAAWYGLLARTPSLGLFHVRPDGPDSLYKFHVRGSAHTARRVLDRHGIAARVLLPHGAGYDVVVPDPGRRMRANTLKAAGHLGGRVEESVGHLEPLGHADPAQARSAFRKIVERYEGGRR